MDNKQWDSLSKPERVKLLKSAGLPAGLSQLKWSGLTKGERKKIEKASKGSGWYEKAKPTRTHKGIKEVAPKHYEVSVKKEAESALNVPMQKKESIHKEQKEAKPTTTQKEEKVSHAQGIFTLGNIDGFKLKYPNTMKELESMVLEHIRDTQGRIDFLNNWMKTLHYDEQYLKRREEELTNPEKVIRETIAKAGIALTGLQIDAVGNGNIRLRMAGGELKGKTAFRCPEDSRGLTLTPSGKLACGEHGTLTSIEKAYDLRKIGKDKATTKWAEEQYKGWLGEAKEAGFSTVADYVKAIEVGGYKEYAKLGVGLEKIFNPEASKKEPPLISDPKWKSYDPKFEESEAERMKREREWENEWDIQEAEEYIGMQGVNPITGKSMGKDWDNLSRESWAESEVYKDEFNELVTEAMLSSATSEDYDAWKARFIGDTEGTLKKLKDLVSNKRDKEKDWREIERAADKYTESTCNIKGTRYPKKDCRRILVAVSSGWKSGGVMLKREALDEAKKYRAQGFRVRVEKVI